MPRIVSVWLKNWPIRRFRRAVPAAPGEAPLVLATTGPGPRVAAVDEAAAALGLRPGEALADARARVGQGLRVEPVDPAADAAALARLCVWATRYAPVAAAWGEAEGADGFFLDVTGAAHLAGGEAALLDDLRARLDARVAVAETPGLSWALSRFGEAHLFPSPLRGGAGVGVVQDRALSPTRNHPHLLPPPRKGEETCLVERRQRPSGLSPTPAVPAANGKSEGAPNDPRTLPVAALRLSAETQAALRRLGFRQVGQLLDAARAPLARRFGDALLVRLDQMLGRRPEPLVPVRTPPAYGAVRRLLDPIARQETVVAHARRLMAELAVALEAADVGARRLRLTLYRVDGHAAVLEFGLATPTRSPDHLARLLRLRLDRPGEGLSAGFGFEALRLEALSVGPLEPHARGFDGPRPADLAARLADALAQRVGRRLARLAPVASHRPERSVARAGVAAPTAGEWEPSAGPRPLVLLRKAEPVEDVLAAVPDGPPHRFRWRGRLHRVAHAQGPERIAPEWWRGEGGTRDYYVVEDAAARRLWLYREGLYGEAPPRWFVHGLFA